MGMAWTDVLLSKRHSIFLGLCFLFLCLNVYTHHAARLYLHKVTDKFFQRQPELAKDTAEEVGLYTVTKKSSGDVLRKIQQFYATSVAPSTGYLSSSSIPDPVPTSTTPSVPGVDSMDKALDLSALVSDEKNNFPERRDHNFIISHNDTCSSLKKADNSNQTSHFDFENDIFLIMAVKSKCESRDRRDAVRKTWGNEIWCRENLGVRMKIVFLVGRCEDDNGQSAIFEEDRRSSDILQWDFTDSFRKLTLKLCLYMQWFAKHCRHVPFVFNGDDDVFVNIKNIVQFLKLLPFDKAEELYAGSRLKGSPRILDPKSKYYVSSSLFPGKYYPPYVSGGGYLLSGELLVNLFVESLKTRLIPIDDAFLGILAKSLGVQPANDNTFKSWGLKVVDDCRIAKIKTFHRALPDKLVKMWNSMLNVNISQCGVESDDVFHHQF